MKISSEMLDEFIRIHEAKHGEKLDRDEAYEEAINLMRLIEIVESNSVPKWQ